MTNDHYQLRASFLRGVQGALFSLWALPEDTVHSTGVLLVPPFAEEMNRCRRMVSLQAKALAGAGFRTLMVDLFGTGDSAGEFAEASVRTWVQDLSIGSSALIDEGCSTVVIVAVRFGALLAVEHAAAAGQGRVKGLIFWQPVQTGKAFMTQFLRLRLAAELTSGASSLTVKDLQQQLSQGHPVDVAGYELSPQLYGQSQSLSLLENESVRAAVPAEFMEISARDSDELSPGIRLLRDGWAQQGARVSALKIKGEPFWQTPEITVAPELISATVRAVRDLSGAT